MQNENFLETEPIKKLFYKLAIPTVISQIINLLYNIVDRMYIGHIHEVGNLALTAIGICMPIILILSAFGSLIGSGGSPRASLCMGKKQNNMAEQILGNCTLFLIILSIIISIIFRMKSEQLLLLFGASKDTLPYALDYMNIYILGSIFVITSISLNFFIIAQAYTKISMIINCIGAFSNIILDPLFIFTFNLGIKGAALATILSQALSAILCLVFLTSKNASLKIKIKYLKINKEVLFPCLLLGSSPFIMQVTECVISICFNRNLGIYGGDIAIGSMSIFSTIMQFATLIMQGFCNGCQPIISYNYGLNKINRVLSAIKQVLKVNVFYTCSLWLIIMLAPRIFICLFTNNEFLINTSVTYIRYFFLMLFLMGPQFTFQNCFLALGNAKTSFFLAIWRKIILLTPLIFILPIFITNKIAAVFLAEAVADTLASLTTSTMFILYFKKIINTKSYKIS